MEFFIVYRLDSGEELMRGSGPEGTASIQQLGDNRGVVVIPEYAGNNMVPLSDIPIDDLRASLWESAKVILSQMTARGAQTDWGVVDSSQTDLFNLQTKAGVAMLRRSLGDPRLLKFTLKDNSVVELTPLQMMIFSGQAMEFVDGIANYARTLRESLYAAETVTEVLAVDIFRGWPALSAG